MRSLVVHIVLFSLVSTSVVVSAEPSLVEKEWTVDGVARQAMVHVPAVARETAAPVVFAFHGHGGNMNQAARSFSYHTVWPEAIVVYMQGLNTPGKLTDPDGKRPGWQSSSGDQDDRDLKFFDTVLASLKSDVKVDEKRIYATGHSNGGGFTYLLWATRGDVFAAVAPSAAMTNRDFKTLTPKPVLHVAGTNDQLVKWEWQKLMIDVVKKLNGCDADGAEWDKAGDLVGTIYSSKTGTPVVTVISPGNHRFPSDAPRLIVKFFKEHAKK